jgi:hypothetical protein
MFLVLEANKYERGLRSKYFRTHFGGHELQVRTRYIEINKNNTTMTGENQPLVTDEPVKFNK